MDVPKINEEVWFGKSPLGEIIDRICVQRSKRLDDAVFGEIREIISENEHLTVVNLNEKAIVEALEKQIPKKPIPYDKHYFMCPGCREDLGKDEDAIYVYQEIPPDFCEKCGQALDWSDTDHIGKGVFLTREEAEKMLKGVGIE